MSNREELVKKLKEAAAKMEERDAGSKVLDRKEEDKLPKFFDKEIDLGPVLGKGGFCTVSEIAHFTLASDGPEIEAKLSRERDTMAANVTRKGDARYAIKKLSDSVLTDKERYVNGTLDLAIEARFLSVMRHPNLIKLRGMAGTNPFEDGYFLILDRLYGTLEDTIPVWRKEFMKAGSLMSKMKGIKKKEVNDHWIKRITVSHDLAAALKYMHSKGVIYRDLKTENIGFDVRGDVKIFDLGLAKELHPEDEMEDGLYKLTGYTGSLRYMAPEVNLCKPYNLSADVYSWSMVFWEICSLTLPFKGYTVRMYEDLIVKKGYRPAVDKKWDKRYADLLRASWSAKIEERPSFVHICKELTEEVRKLTGTRRSLKLEFNRSLRSVAFRGSAPLVDWNDEDDDAAADQ